MNDLDGRYLSFTGNPFVDAGLTVALCKGKKIGLDTEDINNVRLDDFAKIVGNGEWIAEANRKLKAFTMVVGINSLLTNASMNPSLSKKKKKDMSPTGDIGRKEYIKILIDLSKNLKPIISTVFADQSEEICEICGMRHATRILEKGGKSIGRDWFPLAGTLGNDAQALPAASRTLKICAVCLLAIQMLPQGVMLIHGKLACFQSTQFMIPRFIVEAVYKTTDETLATTPSNSKIPAVGAKNTKTLCEMLLQTFKDLKQHGRMNDLPSNTTLYLWLFSNSGTSPDCEIMEIPNHSLSFLYDAERSYPKEILALIKNDRAKKPDNQLFNCIQKRKDYYGLYPSTKNKIKISKELFKLALRIF